MKRDRNFLHFLNRHGKQFLYSWLQEILDNQNMNFDFWT